MIPEWMPPKELRQQIPRKAKPRVLAFVEILSCLTVWILCGGYAALLYETRGVISMGLLFYAALFAVFWVFLLSKFYREMMLVSRGQTTQAILIGDQEAFQILGKNFLSLAYDFFDDSGLRISGKVSTRTSEEVHPKRLTVLFDPKKSARNVLYPPRYVIAVGGDQAPVPVDPKPPAPRFVSES